MQKFPRVSRQALTDRFVKALKAPDGRIEIGDARCRGLSIRCTPAGIKTWTFAYKLSGRMRRILLVALGDSEVEATETVRLALKGVLLTAQRPGEVAGMMLSELHDLDGPTPHWIIPRLRTKNKKTEHTVPLSPAAVDLIRQALKLSGKYTKGVNDKPVFASRFEKVIRWQLTPTNLLFPRPTLRLLLTKSRYENGGPSGQTLTSESPPTICSQFGLILDALTRCSATRSAHYSSSMVGGPAASCSWESSSAATSCSSCQLARQCKAGRTFCAIA